MQRFLANAGISLLGFLSGLALISLFVISLRLHIEIIGLIGYFIVSVSMLVFSIVRHLRRKATKLLIFGISFFVSTLVLFAGFVFLIVMALKSFT